MYKNMKKQDDIIIKKINSLMLAILLTASFIAKVLASLNIISEGIVPFIFLMSLLISYSSVLFLGFKKFKLNIYVISLIYIILFNFLLTILFYGSESYAVNYLIEFIAFGLIIFLITLIPYDYSRVIYFVMVIGNLVILNPIGFVDFITLEDISDRVNMGASYAMLPTIVATIIYLFSNINKAHKKIRWINLISYLSNGYLFLILLIEGTRGAVLSILMLFFLIIYIRMKSKVVKGVAFISPILWALYLGTIYIIILKIDAILLWINNRLLNMGIEIATITKTAYMFENRGFAGVLNGRDIVYEKALDLFKQSPLIGNGIGSYADLNNGTYPHNLFLQLLVEGGLLFVIPFIAVVIMSLTILIKSWNINTEVNQYKYFILFLFIVCMPKLMLSSYLWREPSFWLLTFVVISKSTQMNYGHFFHKVIKHNKNVIDNN